MHRGVGGCGSSHSIFMPFMASMRPMVMMRTVLTLRLYLLYYLVSASPSRPNTSISAAPKEAEAAVLSSIRVLKNFASFPRSKPMVSSFVIVHCGRFVNTQSSAARHRGRASRKCPHIGGLPELP